MVQSKATFDGLDTRLHLARACSMIQARHNGTYLLQTLGLPTTACSTYNIYCRSPHTGIFAGPMQVDAW